MDWELLAQILEVLHQLFHVSGIPGFTWAHLLDLHRNSIDGWLVQDMLELLLGHQIIVAGVFSDWGTFCRNLNLLWRIKRTICLLRDGFDKMAQFGLFSHLLNLVSAHGQKLLNRNFINHWEQATLPVFGLFDRLLFRLLLVHGFDLE